MYITNQPAVARIAEDAGVDWIFVDMEFIGKDKRQGGLDTVQNHHTIEDVSNIKKSLKRAQVIVREILYMMLLITILLLKTRLMRRY